ncbi:MAG: hypothetical protein IJQ88_11930, partial [Clostridia bacterium]|nr:hypothetical protein [Clostridia bacterium]
METHGADPRKAGRSLLWIYGAALLYFVLKQCCCLAFLRGFADEGNHISYVLNMARFPSLLPDFRAMTFYNDAGMQDGLTL